MGVGWGRESWGGSGRGRNDALVSALSSGQEQGRGGGWASWPTGASVALSRATLTAALGLGKLVQPAPRMACSCVGSRRKVSRGSDETAAHMRGWGPSTQGRARGRKATLDSGLPGSH